MVSTAMFVLVHVSFLLGVGMIVIVAWKTRSSQIRTAFIVTLGVMTIWNFGTLLEMDFHTVTGAAYTFFIDICYIGICLAPIAILYLGKAIMQPDWRPKPIHTLFLAVPFVSIVMVFTNPLHHLFFVTFSLYSSEAVYGAYYFFHSVYSYGCIVAGIVMMIVASLRNFGIFSKQSLLLVAGIIIALVPNMLYSFGVGNLPFSISTVAFTFTVLCFAVAFLKYRFVTALPISLRQVVDLISDGYLVVDGNMRILAYNRALLHLFPEPVNIALEMNLSEFIDNYFLDITIGRFLDLQASAVKQHRTVSAEGQISGGAFVSVEVTPVMRNNAHIGSIMLIKDITQSKQLIEATQAASRAKSEFLSHMSHEIRTPLNAIIGMINIGMGTSDVGKKDYCFERAGNASRHLLGLVNDVLDMSKIEADMLELYYSEFAFEKMLEGIIDVVGVRAEEKQHNLVVSLGEGIPEYIVSDELRLSQVITNLLTNAIKFTPEKGRIALSAEKVEEVGDEVCLRIEVEDTGIGISQKQQAGLFDPFNQANADTTKKYGGTGLGLAIAKRIIELMGGEIWIESELGKGAKFIFTVKVEQIVKKPQIKQAINIVTDFNDTGKPEQSTALDSNYNFSKHTLLVAEDIDINREIIGAMLEETGVSVGFAENGMLAVSMFKEQPEKYDMILMDVNMPEMDGHEATRAIRALDTGHAKSIPIIAMTANVFKEDIDKCLASGMNGHIGKPIDKEALIRMLKKYLAGPDASAAPGESLENQGG